MTALVVVAVSEWGVLDPSFVQLIDRQAASQAFQIAALGIAAAVGAVHALAPGHGKALVGAYLAGSRGQARDAVALGGLVASMHTGSVLLLGGVFYLTQRMPTGERLGAVLTLVSAAAVVAVGGAMLWRQRGTVRAYRAARARQRSPVAAHAVGVHAPDAAHQHLPAGEGVPPLSRSGLVALATTGGLLPSPAAFLVLVTALAMGRVGYGLALVAAFSVGLAATLTAIGLAVLSGRSLLLRHAQRRAWLLGLSRLLPPLAAAGVLAGGLLMAGVAIARL